MGDEVSYGAEEYAQTKQLPFRTDVERYTLFNLMGDFNGKRILDAGCGDGIYSRKLVDLGASQVLGVDSSEDFIRLAREKSERYGERLDFERNFIQDFPGKGDFDLVMGSYILSYPRSLEEAVGYCRAIASHLKPGGRFVGFNNNPFEVFDGKRYSHYGFEKEMHGDKEGGEVIYRVEGMDNEIVNYFLKPNTLASAFELAGLKLNWGRVLLDKDTKQTGDYWKEFFEGEPPFIAMVARKPYIGIIVEDKN